MTDRRMQTLSLQPILLDQPPHQPNRLLPPRRLRHQLLFPLQLLLRLPRMMLTLELLSVVRLEAL